VGLIIKTVYQLAQVVTAVKINHADKKLILLNT